MNGNRRRYRETNPVEQYPVFAKGGERLTKIKPREDSGFDPLRKRALASGGIVVVAVALLVARLWFLQWHLGDHYAELANTNRVRSIDIIAPRGNIYDRADRELVANRPGFNVVWSREDSVMDDLLLKHLAKLMGEDVSVLVERLQKAQNEPRHLPVRLKEDIDWDTVALVENNRMDLPGIRIEVAPQRAYAHENMASHLLGYLGEINREELDAAEPGVYQGGNLIGKQGIEKLREKHLRGEKGRDYMEVNALGFEQRYLKSIEPLPGNDLKLTIDIELQSLAEGLLAEAAGAAVMMEVNTGRLLVAASSPPLQLGHFVGGISQKNWDAMRNNPLKPLINKVAHGQYPPGSTYKMVTAAAGLAEGVITSETSFYCPGFYSFGNRVYRCWKHSGHGTVNLHRALSESCDVYFYQVGQRLGVDRLAKYASKMGLGRPTGVEMEHEKSGLVPSSAWKQQRYNVPWQDGETLSVAIGQGFNLVTPLQLCATTAMLANGGTLYRPRLIESVRSSEGKVVEQLEPEVMDHLNGQARNLRLVRNALVEAVNGARGTGKKARLATVTVAGKTGTAQVVRLAQYKHLQEEDIPYEYRDHAWFTCFAPAENPVVAVTVLVEHGLHGGSAAAPIAGALLRHYFGEKKEVEAEAIPVPTPE